MVRFLTSDYAILLALLLTLWLLLRQTPSIVRNMWLDSERGPRLVSRVALGTIAAFLLWTTVFDNWRELLGLLVGRKKRWRSDPYLLGPPDHTVRVLTIVLLIGAVLAGAWLFARYASGYLLPIVVPLVGIALFFTINSLRMRFESEGPLFDGTVDWTRPSDVAATLIWFAMLYIVFVILIFSAYGILWGPVALVVSLAYRLTIGRRKVADAPLFGAFEQQLASRKSETKRPT